MMEQLEAGEGIVFKYFSRKTMIPTHVTDISINENWLQLEIAKFLIKLNNTTDADLAEMITSKDSTKRELAKAMMKCKRLNLGS